MNCARSMPSASAADSTASNWARVNRTVTGISTFSRLVTIPLKHRNALRRKGSGAVQGSLRIGLDVRAERTYKVHMTYRENEPANDREAADELGLPVTGYCHECDSLCLLTVCAAPDCGIGYCVNCKEKYGATCIDCQQEQERLDAADERDRQADTAALIGVMVGARKVVA